jgi:hypothetical protein
MFNTMDIIPVTINGTEFNTRIIDGQQIIESHSESVLGQINRSYNGKLTSKFSMDIPSTVQLFRRGEISSDTLVNILLELGCSTIESLMDTVPELEIENPACT